MLGMSKRNSCEQTEGYIGLTRIGKALWNDESPYTVFGQSTRSHILCRPEQALHPNCVDATVKHGGAKNNVWGCFNASEVRNLRVQKILEHQARPSLICLGDSIYQQDNNPNRTAESTVSYLPGDRWPADLKNWPPQSPDINPVDNSCSHLDSQIRKRHPKPRDTTECYNTWKKNGKIRVPAI